ncbi:MAG: glycosyltransferase, partial [Clostridia bacterium]|nr:glycosyltransferase [Clostridia bacterium]
MKILMIGEGMEIGGCETHIYELTRALVQLGHEVVLLCVGGRYARALEKLGVRVLYAPTNQRTPHALISTALKIRRLLGEHFDVVHTHTRGMSALVHRLTKIAHTVTVHLDFPVNALTRRFCHFGDSTLAVSEDIRAYLVREYGLCENEVLLTRNGVDTAHFGACDMGSDIVHLSRLDRDRSLCALLLCEVAPFVLKKEGTRKIHIYGDGNDMPRVRKMAKKANEALQREGVILHGKTEDIRSSLARGNIFVGVSRALLEAMAAGRACIVCGNEGY